MHQDAPEAPGGPPEVPGGPGDHSPTICMHFYIVQFEFGVILSPNVRIFTTYNLNLGPFVCIFTSYNLNLRSKVD